MRIRGTIHLVARRGGDEFIAVMIRANDQSPADSPVARIGNAIIDARAAICPDLCSTATITTLTRHPDESIDDLLSRADAVLCEKKQAVKSAHARSVTAEIRRAC